MDYTQILLLINSLLLAIISALFFIAGYFLRDLHRDFKILIERVNKLYTDLYTHINWFDNISKMFQKQIENIETKIKQLEEKVIGNKK
jgi:hypothetical protein